MVFVLVASVYLWQGTIQVIVCQRRRIAKFTYSYTPNENGHCNLLQINSEYVTHTHTEWVSVIALMFAYCDLHTTLESSWKSCRSKVLQLQNFLSNIHRRSKKKTNALSPNRGLPLKWQFIYVHIWSSKLQKTVSLLEKGASWNMNDYAFIISSKFIDRFWRNARRLSSILSKSNLLWW